MIREFTFHRRRILWGIFAARDVFMPRFLHNEIEWQLKHQPKLNPLDKNQEATVYVHWPFCKHICTFCNFNKYISNNVEHQRMRKCLETECRTLLRLSGIKTIKSVYFGGGTPSLAEPSTISIILECINKECTMKYNAEVTMEANPTSAERNKLREFKAAGINRLSLGIQTLNESDLTLLGRQGSTRESLTSLETAKQLFPGRVSVDLIFGRPNQTPEAWEKELNEIIPLCDRHVSLYQLTLHRGTPLYQQVRAGEVALPSNDTMADLYHIAIQVLKESGFHQYEVSNFAKPGSESHHNMSYWQGDPYIGVGPGAHGRFYCIVNEGVDIARYARVQTLEPNAWMTEVEQFGHATRKAVPQSKLEILEEIVMLGLRTTEGIPNERFGRYMEVPCSLSEIFSSSPDVQDFSAAGLLNLDHRGMRATRDGIPVVDSLTPVIVLHLEQYFKSLNSPSRS